MSMLTSIYIIILLLIVDFPVSVYISVVCSKIVHLINFLLLIIKYISNIFISNTEVQQILIFFFFNCFISLSSKVKTWAYNFYVLFSWSLCTKKIF